MESLEDRRVPATFGVPWPDAQHLTISFVPDGTPVNGRPSQLGRMLDAQVGAGAWQGQVLRAFQTWADVANVNIGLAADGGQAVGTPGAGQGDPRFGDIRISAVPLSPGLLAVATPYSPEYGTLSGDVVLNSNYDFNPADPGHYDLFTVLLHEAGHTLGLPDTDTDTSSVMYESLLAPRTGLGPADAPALQAIYGARVTDASEGPGGNDSLAGATEIKPPSDWDKSSPLTTDGDITTPGDVDTFRFTTPNGELPNGMDVRVQTSGFSLFAPAATVHDASGAVVASGAITDPMSGDLLIHLDSVQKKAQYYVQVRGATGDAFGVGAFRVALDFQPDSGDSGPAGKATPIPNPGGYDGSVPLMINGTISGNKVRDSYQITTPKTGLPNGVTFRLQTWGIGLLPSQLTAYDASGDVVGSTAGADASGGLSVHLGSVASNAVYYLKVTGGTTNKSGLGVYQLRVDYRPDSAGLPPSAFAPNPAADAKGSSVDHAVPLSTSAGYAPQTRYGTIGSIAAPTEQDFYQVAAPKAKGNQASVMTVTVSGLEDGGLNPWIAIFDDKGQPVSAQVLSNQGGLLVVQVANARSGADYVVRVGAAQPGGGHDTGNYYLGVSFGAVTANLQQFAGGMLLHGAVPEYAPVLTLTVRQDQTFQFILTSSEIAGAAAAAGVQMVITDQSGNVVATLTDDLNQSQSLIVFLERGTYTIQFRAIPGQDCGSLDFWLLGTTLTDPIKPYTYSGSGTTSTSP